MGKVKVGFRQLFLARACSIKDDQDVIHSMLVDGYHVDLYIGRNPTLPIASQSKKIIPYDPIQNTPFPMGTISIRSVSDSEFAGGLFTDVFCYKEVEVPDSSLERFNDSKTEIIGKIEVLDFVKKNYGKEFEAITNYISGMIGLRFHAQFVFELINEIYWAWSEKEQAWSIDSIHGPTMQFLEGITLNGSGKESILGIKFNPGTTVELMRSAAISLTLLKQGWHEENTANKFINLFTSLEVAIKSRISGKIKKPEELIRQIENLVSAHSDDKTRKEMLAYIRDSCPKYKSLKSMFNELATEAKFEKYDNDIKFFKIFNQNRNELIHGGQSDKLLSASLKDGSSIQFQDLVERYVNWVFFGDGNYYLSRFRARIPFMDSKSDPA